MQRFEVLSTNKLAQVNGGRHGRKNGSQNFWNKNKCILGPTTAAVSSFVLSGGNPAMAVGSLITGAASFCF